MTLICIVRSQHIVLLFLMQLMISLFLIYNEKNEISYVTEIVLLFVAVFFNRPAFEIAIVFVYIAEYLLMKLLLVLIVAVVKLFAFYSMVIISHKNKMMHKYFISNKRFVRVQSHIWRNVDYGIRLKKGIPQYVGTKHKGTGVKYDRNGFPVFDEIATVRLKPRDWKKDRSAHFYRASKLLYEKINKKKRFKGIFSVNEIKELQKGGIPEKYTWHHHQNRGVLQLVDREIHEDVRHDGGFSIWGKPVKKKKAKKGKKK